MNKIMSCCAMLQSDATQKLLCDAMLLYAMQQPVQQVELL